jgi:hypothetical protein
MCGNNNNVLQNKTLFVATGNPQRKKHNSMEYSPSSELTKLSWSRNSSPL